MPTTASSMPYQALVPETYKIRKSKQEQITHKICKEVWDWVKASDQAKGTSTVSTRSRKTLRNDSPEASGNDRNGGMIRTEDPPITRPQLESFQKRKRRANVSAINEGRPIKQSRKTNTDEMHPGPDPELDAGLDLDPDPNLDADAGLDPSLDPNPGPGTANTSGTRTSIGESSNAKDDKAMEESIFASEQLILDSKTISMN
ncbi:hypothetical protein CEP54_014580 [Fusarium duplospermum]|uniref:Uncharacterized protein n=1 Tax=Fusarium duplospermum TaxID=1325734 RepID=A0A428NVA1_9HYPO|nr:hypothetical protein CEP54_014580 [Fusarium duplospermum]